MKTVEIIVEVTEGEQAVLGFPAHLVLTVNQVLSSVDSFTTSYAATVTGTRFSFFYTPVAGTIQFNWEALVEIPMSAGSFLLVADEHNTFGDMKFKTSTGTSQCLAVMGS